METLNGMGTFSFSKRSEVNWSHLSCAWMPFVHAEATLHREEAQESESTYVRYEMNGTKAFKCRGCLDVCERRTNKVCEIFCNLIRRKQRERFCRFLPSYQRNARSDSNKVVPKNSLLSRIFFSDCKALVSIP